MAFTDEELKRLKEHYEIHVEGSEPCLGEDSDLIKALLARLEAAEKVCNSCEMEMMEKHYDGDALLAWRKSRGEK